jgi:hypothetical protein
MITTGNRGGKMKHYDGAQGLKGTWEIDVLPFVFRETLGQDSTRNSPAAELVAQETQTLSAASTDVLSELLTAASFSANLCSSALWPLSLQLNKQS